MIFEHFFGQINPLTTKLCLNGPRGQANPATGFGSGEFQGQVMTKSSMSCASGGSWAVFVGWQPPLFARGLVSSGCAGAAGVCWADGLCDVAST